MENIEENFIKLSEKCALLTGGKTDLIDGFKAASNSHDLWFSRVFNPVIKSDSSLEELINSIKKKSLPNTLLISEEYLKNGVDTLLEGRGFKTIVEQTLMSIKLDQNEFEDDFNDLRVVKKSSELKEWFSVAKVIFGKQSIDLFEMLFKEDDILFLTGYIEEKPVATSMVFLTDIPGIHLVGTLPDARGRGLATKLTKYALKLAKERGYSEFVLQASNMGRTVYEKIGFKSHGKIYHKLLND